MAASVRANDQVTAQEADSGGVLRSGEGLQRQERLRQVAAARRTGVSLPMAFALSPEVEKGIKELNNFGFRTTALQGDPSVVTTLPAGHRQRYGFHVSDLWSQRQQQEFLKRLRLERAQFARERQVAFLNYLIQNKKKLYRPVLDALSPRYDHRLEGGKGWERWRNRANTVKKPEVSAGDMALPMIMPTSSTRSLLSVDSKAPHSPSSARLTKVQDLIGHCQSAQQSLRRDSKAISQAFQSFRGKGSQPDSPSSPIGVGWRRRHLIS